MEIKKKKRRTQTMLEKIGVNKNPTKETEKGITQ